MPRGGSAKFPLSPSFFRGYNCKSEGKLARNAEALMKKREKQIRPIEEGIDRSNEEIINEKLKNSTSGPSNTATKSGKLNGKITKKSGPR